MEGKKMKDWTIEYERMIKEAKRQEKAEPIKTRKIRPAYNPKYQNDLLQKAASLVMMGGFVVLVLALVAKFFLSKWFVPTMIFAACVVASIVVVVAILWYLSILIGPFLRPAVLVDGKTEDGKKVTIEL